MVVDCPLVIFGYLCPGCGRVLVYLSFVQGVGLGLPSPPSRGKAFIFFPVFPGLVGHVLLA